MIKILLTVFVLLCIVSFDVGAQKKPGKPVVIVGEVVDSQCYLVGAMGSARGAEHKECAISCAKGGIPLSILEEKTNTLYLTGQNKRSMTTANVLLMDYVAERVKVTGRLVEKAGVKMVLIDKVEKQPLP